tara:strand:- start:49821 stop:50495 length:675 start_codon:yes stop_codon:yes gene_type:complete
MGFILNIESSSTNCSISISKNGKLIDYIEKNDPKYRQSAIMHQNILDLIKKNNLNINDFAAVAISKGPGSYTGLRVGLSSAKGLCYALDIPLISINTLEIIAAGLRSEVKGNIVSLVHAREDEFYYIIYNNKMQIIKQTSVEFLNSNSFLKFYGEYNLNIIGSGIDICKKIIKNKKINYPDCESLPSSKNMVILSEKKFKKEDFENLIYFEPNYMKNFHLNKKK